MQTLKSGILYFAVVFGAGFILGPIRILWAIPRFGTRTAELMEMPIMLVVIVIYTGWSSLAAAAGLAVVGLAVGHRRPHRGTDASPPAQRPAGARSG